MSEDLHDDDSDESSVQLLRSAGEAPPPRTSAPRSVFDWRPNGSEAKALPEDTRPQKASRAKPPEEPAKAGPVPRNQQQLICRLMTTREGAWERETLEAGLPDLDKRQFNSALYNAIDNKRIKKVGGDYVLTNKGLAFAAKSAMPAKRKQPPAPVAPPVAAKARSAGPRLEPTRAPGQWPLITVMDMPARFAAYSDGGFLIEKNGLQISLSAEENRAMRTYQEKHL